ncbi:MAG: PAS domain-containing protein [Lachnospiraceae bacterium]|nr:PAS domain-containing protein [Lachnospiraceae bacterium]
MPPSKQAALDAFSKHVSDYTGRTPFDPEYRLQRKDGTYRWFKAIGKTVRESDGTPIVVAGSIPDITDSKKNKEIEDKMKSSVTNLSQSLSEMTKTVGINENISSQGAAMEEINANIEELNAMAETIKLISIGLEG